MSVPRKDQIPALVVVALAVAAGLVMIALTGAERSNFVDSEDYIAAAQMILRDGTYPVSGVLPFFRAPLYPMFMAGIWGLFSESYLAIKLIQIALHAASAFFVFRTAEIVSGNRMVAFIAGVLFAINPFFAFNAVAIQTEVLFTFLITLAVFMMAGLLIRDDISIRNAVIMGVAFGLGALCKPSALGVCFVFIAFFAIYRFRSRLSFIASAATIAAMFLVILPWSFYNLKTKGEFILINDASGWVMWIGNVPESLAIYEGNFATPREAIDYQDYVGKTLSDQQIAEFERSVGYSALTYKQREALWRAKAFELMAADPTTAAKLFLWKFYLYWKPFISGEVFSPLQVAVSALYGIPLFVMGIFGVFMYRNDVNARPFAMLFLTLAIFTTAVHVFIVSGVRLRLPYIDPFLTIFAAMVINSILVWAADRFQVIDVQKFFNNNGLMLDQGA
jgi:hypothetical protein